MTTSPDNGEFIWATRGRSWGFRFLRTGGLKTPLTVYEEVFAAIGDQAEVWRRVGDKCAVRFPDPAGRRDAAGRVIPHEFVLLGRWAHDLNSLDDARGRLWHEVAEEFERVWAQPEPPTP